MTKPTEQSIEPWALDLSKKIMAQNGFGESDTIVSVSAELQGLRTETAKALTEAYRRGWGECYDRFQQVSSAELRDMRE